ncbi:hypothetical protein RKD19_004367 [Streptomyces canus]
MPRTPRWACPRTPATTRRPRRCWPPSGIDEIDLLSNNPDKAGQLRDLGIGVHDRVPTGVFTTAHNVRYLRAKVLQTQHTLPLGELTELGVG